MQRSLKLQNYKIAKLQNAQRGYMMITLVLVLALITIALLTVLPEIGQQIRRDREEEMIHRGTAYMRAIQHFYRKFGRYPSRVEELENTNNLRYLRKRYTDPMNRDPVTGKERDFKFLHQPDITLNNSPVLQPPPNEPPVPPAGLQQPDASTLPPASGDSSSSSSGSSSDAGANSSGSSPSTSNADSNFGSNGPTLGGGPILGVASTNKKDKTIRVFYQKNHYNDWLFFYVGPQADQGGLLKGPVNPGAPIPNLNPPPSSGQQ